MLERARREGFDVARVTTPSGIPLAAERLSGWLEAGHHGSMGWMADRSDWRGDPARLWPEAR